MIARIIQCAYCKTYDISEKGMFYGRKVPGREVKFLGEWPLYYFGAGPHDPDKAPHYFCGVNCACDYYEENMRDAT